MVSKATILRGENNNCRFLRRDIADILVKFSGFSTVIGHGKEQKSTGSTALHLPSGCPPNYEQLNVIYNNTEPDLHLQKYGSGSTFTIIPNRIYINWNTESDPHLQKYGSGSTFTEIRIQIRKTYWKDFNKYTDTILIDLLLYIDNMLWMIYGYIRITKF